MAEGRTTARPIHLRFKSTRQVVVEPEDEDRFFLTAREAARACKQFEDEKEWNKQFDLFLVYLHEWCERHAAKVKAACVSIGDGTLNILIVTKSPDFDIEFDDALTDLDLALAKEFPWYNAEVMQIPSSAKDGESSIEKAVLVYGDGERTQGAGPA